MVKGSIFPKVCLNYSKLLLLLITALGLLPMGEVRSQSNSHNKEILLNNRPLSIAWSQWEQAGKTHIGISDTGIAQILGVDLLNTNDPTKQPIQWFNDPKTTPIVLATKLNGGYRYLDVTNFSPPGWQFAVKGNALVITSPTAKIQDIRLGKQTFGDRIVVDLDRPTSWQVNQQAPPPKPKTAINELVGIVKAQIAKQVWLITIDGNAKLAIADTFNSPQFQIEIAPTLTNIRLNLPVGMSPRITTLTNPPRLVIDIRPDAMAEKNILWADGLRWRQQYLGLGEDRFAVTWLEVNPAKNIKMMPFWSEATTLIGTAPLIKTAERYNAVAAINSGFFNRKNQLPLGAIRRDGNWISSPILNRGAIAWDNTGKIKIGRLSIQESVTTNTGQTLPIKTFNSGYVQTGIARYSPAWGATYSPLTDNETVITVQNNAVTAQLPGGEAGKAAFSIPVNGYLLVARGNNLSIPVGTIFRLQSATIPADFAAYPQILAAGPVLMQNRQIVLDAKAEGFSDAFIREKAIRSAICTTASSTLR